LATRTGRSRDDRRHGGHVDRAGAVATSAAGVDDGAAGRVEGDAVTDLEHGPHECRELGRGLALGPHRDGERGDLGVGGVALQDLGHGLAGEIRGQVFAAQQT